MKRKSLSSKPDLTLSPFGMSNFDGVIDDEMESELKAGKLAEHAAWNFHGNVWFSEGKFIEQISQYHVVVAEYEAESLQELMKEVNDEYGND